MQHPERIFIFRHSERVDHVDREWAFGAERPHDAPLTEQGKAMALAAGEYLHAARLVHPKDVIILSSPLTRCVQTAHAIIDGLCRDDPTVQVPIVIEHGLTEGTYWMNGDMRRNRGLAGSQFPPSPVVYDGAHHHKHTSSRVLPEVNFQLAEAPVYGVSPAASGSDGLIPAASKKELREGPLASNAKEIIKPVLVERVPVSERCGLGAKAVARHRDLFGKVVLLIGHGETTVLWAKALAAPQHAIDSHSPPYTGFLEFLPRQCQEDQGKVAWIPQGSTLGAPHLQKKGEQRR